MASTTPPPPRRIRTPPTPLYGPKHDSHEPYSPRRSSRLHDKPNSHPSLDSTSMTTEGQSRAAGPRPQSSRKPIFRRTASQTFSPPSSPASPSKKQASAHSSSMNPADNVGAAASLRKAAGNGKPELSAMLPTPSKTPRKRAHQAETQLKTTARVLFPSRPQNDEDIMPSPRRARKGKKHTAFSLESFAEECENGDKIEIYTDSKERIPELDESEENPFFVRKNGRRSKASEPRSATNGSKKTKYGMSKEIDEAVENEEGMVYVFRGKKIFRKFDNSNGVRTTGDDEQGVSDQEVLRRAGTAARRPFTRSSVKPRLLFPPTDAEPNHGDEDEEADTDIERKEPVSETEEAETLITPVKQQFQPATPPTTESKQRTKRTLSADKSPDHGDDGEPRQGTAKIQKKSPFDAFQRTKPAASGSSVSLKRHAEPMEKDEGVAGKRTRSGAHDSA